MSAKELFNAAYAQTMRSADLLEQRDSLRELSAEEATNLARWLQEAHCAALELSNRLKGMPAPRRGD